MSRPRHTRRFSPDAARLAGLLTLAGTAHFALPRPYDAIVPRRLPGRPRTWTHLSGAAELGAAALVAFPRTRRLGGLITATLFVAVFPANVKMAMDWSHRPWRWRLLAYARLPLQVPLVLWALRVARRPRPAAA